MAPLTHTPSNLLLARISLISTHLARSFSLLFYQLDLVTPGNLPSKAKVRKQMRHIWNRRIYARPRPQMRQRLYARTLNFGVF